MENLYELALLTSDNKQVVLSLMSKRSHSPELKLYSILNSRKMLSNREAMLAVYGRHCSSTFSMLKARMKDILIRAIVTQLPKSTTTENRFNILINSLRSSIAARIILHKGHRNLSIQLLENSIEDSIKYQYPEGVLNHARNLVLHYGSTEYNKYKLKKYLDIEQQFLRYIQLEILAENYYIELQKIQLQSLANINAEIKLKALNYANELQNIRDIPARNFIFYKFKVIAIHYEFERDYKSLLNLCNKTEIKFKSPEIESISILITISLQKIWALIHDGQYDLCIKIGNKEMNNLETGRIKWYHLAYYTLKGMIYSEKYSDASKLITRMITHPWYKKLGDSLKELFYINLGYIHLITEAGIAGDPIKLKSQLAEFRLGKFLNTAHVFNKDKRGINVSILLLEIAFLLLHKKYDAIIDRTDSLKAYAGQYLRSDESFRSNCMIKMVLQMSKANFHPVRSIRYTADLRKKLSSVQIAGSGTNIDVEVIPFEVLWDIMVGSL